MEMGGPRHGVWQRRVGQGIGVQWRWVGRQWMCQPENIPTGKYTNWKIYQSVNIPIWYTHTVNISTQPTYPPGMNGPEEWNIKQIRLWSIYYWPETWCFDIQMNWFLVQLRSSQMDKIWVSYDQYTIYQIYLMTKNLMFWHLVELVFGHTGSPKSPDHPATANFQWSVHFWSCKNF